ncbi:hypothetical protein GCM10009839_77530 [Catenulispora yoronensis]|uniref:Uncharacterized protein n=1 Tax=Catenulispora yoronensis TaxID=450799 RepID=A0ABP5GYV1_9ACTN
MSGLRKSDGGSKAGHCLAAGAAEVAVDIAADVFSAGVFAPLRLFPPQALSGSTTVAAHSSRPISVHVRKGTPMVVH